MVHDKQWEKFCQIVGREDLIADPRTAMVAARKTHEALVEQVAAEWARRHPAREVVALLNAASIPASPILSFGDIVGEEHFRVRDMVCEVEHPTAGKLTHYGIAPKFSRTQPAYALRHQC